MYIFQNDNFPSGNFPMMENSIFPIKEVLNIHLSFSFKRFSQSFLENTQPKKKFFQFLSGRRKNKLAAYALSSKGKIVFVLNDPYYYLRLG